MLQNTVYRDRFGRKVSRPGLRWNQEMHRMNKKTAVRTGAVAAIAVLALALTACSKQDNAVAAAAKPQVGVVTLKAEPVSLTTELPGRTSPFRVAEVRPQVNGIVLKRLFTEGGQVKAGQQLYQIDPALYQATLDSQRAALARAEAQVKTAALLAQRYKPLTETRAISRQTYDDAVAARDQAAADVLSAKAAVDTARINLVYTRVLSPIEGIIGRSTVTEGALVTANQTTALASVQQIDPIYVDVVQSSAQLLRLQDQLSKGLIKQAEGQQAAQVTLTLEDGSRYNQDGKLQFSEVTVDQGTGSVTLRAVFPNPDHRLLPGMFVRARLVDGISQQGLLVPQRGVARNQRGAPTVFVVGADDKVELREVVTDRAIGDAWLVTGGVKAGDKIVVEGLQMVKPGVEVTATEASAKSSAPGAPEAAAQAR
jgi:membrane fusion protein (multidrug efflux system)